MNAAHRFDQPLPAEPAGPESVLNQAAHAARNGATHAADFVHQVRDRATDGLASLASEAADGFRDAVETHKSTGADAIASLARSARDAADGFEKQSPEVARIVRNAAHTVERVSANIREQSFADMAKATADFAQRQPKLFFGCGIVAGFVLSRLLRSNSDA